MDLSVFQAYYIGCQYCLEMPETEVDSTHYRYCFWRPGVVYVTLFLIRWLKLFVSAYAKNIAHYD